MLYQLVKLFSSMACLLPAAVSRSLGMAAGHICWPLVPKRRRRMAIDNIMSGLGVDERKAADIAKKSAIRFGPMFMEVLRMPRLNRDNIGQYVTLEGREHLDAALAQGKGAVLATAHSGNWEILGAALAMHGFPLAAVVQRQTNLAMDRFINEYRSQAGMHVTYKQSVREMVKLLTAGKIVGLLMDQDNHYNGVFVEFFGRPASTPQGAAALARLNGAPIVPAFITAKGDGTHTAIIHPPVWVEKTGNREQDILATTQSLTRIIEQHIRKYPAEWFWLHNRWKTPPR
ncbi:MAG TPA: lysophospholipid acyltransferase family protein [Methylomusa anaerophila]|uniref:Phosphatidylinositol mannoside acyltransferase n=1 Tax=Methylomusa anaerophila TaxID=1930071 RepID=A0A348AKG4_9FIRM|nr:lysophospholipid acyltransferase family protein [Methylomusa anaerophila]BBB91562.1 phosphatidylinositol mannoside acyltransferase [Methylomusa anaerophila]HML89500.1 lysophospholipid acyltransferase family protein [Methylomusa anaerophila]